MKELDLNKSPLLKSEMNKSTNRLTVSGKAESKDEKKIKTQSNIDKDDKIMSKERSESI